MTESQKTLVQTSFAQVVPIADTAAGLFYGRLFEQFPEVRPMFKSDMAEQKKKLMQSLAVVVKGLDSLDDIVPAVQNLGRRHVAYGVKDEDYDKVGATLLWTLEQGLGEAFTPAVRDAWAAAYGLLAGIMKEAAAEATTAQRPVPKAL